LSQGHTFINKNLFPCFYLNDDGPTGPNRPFEKDAHQKPYGLHFLQWTSSRHADDWHNMATDDLVKVVERLAALERKLLLESEGFMPSTDAWHDGKRTFGFVTAIKNLGAAVGGSLSHGHQQIALSNTMSKQAYNNWRFMMERGEHLSQHMLETTPKELVIRDLEQAVWLVPRFMKRPFYSILALRDVTKQFLFEMDEKETAAVAAGWADAARAMKETLESIGRDFAYNAVVHNGPGAGLYIEFLPFTQETGGFEQAGIWVCQGRPDQAAQRLRAHVRRGGA
jgi:galactose-1-phosphate uridylyltransferase